MRLLRKTVGLAAWAGLLLWAVPAQAQPVKPNILIIFDTSGSMLDQSCDGSNPPVGNGQGFNSEIYNLKEGMRQALFFVGTDEANFGLMRFPCFENACNLNACPFGNNFGGYYRVDAIHTGGADNNRGCILSTHQANETTYGNWFDNGIAEAIVVPVTDPAQGLQPTGPSDFDPGDANIPTILPWLDQTSTCTGGNITNPEIQAMFNQWTPLGRSLYYARLYFDNYVIPNDDPNLYPCRQNIVILITDGAESCDSDMTTISSQPTVPSDCNAIGSDDEFNPRRQACLLSVPDPANGHPYSIPVYVLTRPTLTGPNDPIALAGGTGAAITASFTDQDALKSALLSIIAAAVPSGEVCNGLDDNCNGLQDEGVSNNCPFDPIGLGHCAVEACNNIDDDCDGSIDEGLPPNACGGPCGEPVPAEIPCNGIDDDCDPGTPDQPVGCTCGVEFCNGVDDDCDGLIDDDDPDLPTGLACGPNPALGECQQGTLICNFGNSFCQGAINPITEVCDGLDENCNGIIDDVVYATPDCTIPNCTTACCDGHLECIGGVDTCVPNAISASEDCNGIDDDCDNRIDEGASCPSPDVCWFGQCVFREPPDGCGSGFHNIEGLCVPNACVGRVCNGGEVCNPVDGQCVDPCAGFTCTDLALVCDPTLVPCDAVNGCVPDDTACVTPDCYLDPSTCPTGEVCVNGACVADPCFDIPPMDCGNQACRAGVCVDTCVGVNCGVGEACEDGICVVQPCGTFVCPPGQSCVDNQCAQDPCGGVSCLPGQLCQDGLCVDDPCRLIVCPSGSQCENGQCVGSQSGPDGGVPDAAVPGDGGPGTDGGVDAAPDASSDPNFRITGTGGGVRSCSTGGAGGAHWLILLGVLGLLWIRRRR